MSELIDTEQAEKAAEQLALTSNERPPHNVEVEEAYRRGVFDLLAKVVGEPETGP